MKQLKWLTATLTAFAALFVMTSKNALVLAAGGVNVSDALNQSGINSGSDMSSIYGDLNGIVFFIMALGGFWIVGMLVWGGMTLAGSGGNPQKRTEGFIKLSLVLVGAYVIFKAYDIAGWATSLGGGGA